MKAMAKKDLLNVGPSTTVITIVGRLDPQKRPTLVPDIADALRQLGHKEGEFIIVMLGDGDKKDEVKERIRAFRVDQFVRVLGTVEHPQTFLAATDIFLLPSMSEGISIAVAEAMAMGLPIVTARAGALPEQLGDGLVDSATGQSLMAGVLVDHKLDPEIDAPLYAAELDKLIRSPDLRKKYGSNGRKNVEKTFDWRQTLDGMFDEIDQAKLPRHDHDEDLPNPAAYFALQDLLLEAHQVSPLFILAPTIASTDAQLLSSNRKPISLLPKTCSRLPLVSVLEGNYKIDVVNRTKLSPIGSTLSRLPRNARMPHSPILVDYNEVQNSNVVLGTFFLLPFSSSSRIYFASSS